MNQGNLLFTPLFITISRVQCILSLLYAIIINSKVTLPVFIVTLSRLNLCTDFNDIWHGDTLISEAFLSLRRLLSIVTTNIHAFGAAEKW